MRYRLRRCLQSLHVQQSLKDNQLLDTDVVSFLALLLLVPPLLTIHLPPFPALRFPFHYEWISTRRLARASGAPQPLLPQPNHPMHLVPHPAADQALTEARPSPVAWRPRSRRMRTQRTHPAQSSYTVVRGVHLICQAPNLISSFTKFTATRPPCAQSPATDNCPNYNNDIRLFSINPSRDSEFLTDARSVLPKQFRSMSPLHPATPSSSHTVTTATASSRDNPSTVVMATASTPQQRRLNGGADFRFRVSSARNLFSVSFAAFSRRLQLVIVGRIIDGRSRR